MDAKARILSAIKALLKRRKITYKELGRRLQVSEVTIKRYLSSGQFPLPVLDAICVALETSFEELLIEASISSAEPVKGFSPEQEQALADDDTLFSAYYLLGGGWDFEKILENFRITRAELTKTLLEIDRLQLIKYLSDEDVRLLLPISTQWSATGLLVKKFKSSALEEFFASQFDGQGEWLRVTLGPLHGETARVIQKKIDRLQDEILHFIQLDQKTISNIEQSDGYWFVTAMRPMNFSVIQKLALKKAAGTLAKNGIG